ncbi:MAG: radical SAM protein [Dehalobacterium sp.]
MKIFLSSLNARFIHSALSLYYLRSFCQVLSHDFTIKEYTINENLLDIAGDIHREKAEMIGFSCYIWNIEPTLKLCSILKKIEPKIFIVLGGPEVSYDPEEILKNNSFIDCVVVGEGEETFYQLVERKAQDLSLEGLSGVVFRKDRQIMRNPHRPLISKLDQITFPYSTYDLINFSGKIIYYESSRGCPFNCQYCLSSTIHGVRYFSMERVQDDLEKIILSGVKQVKFVDRTFNCHQSRTKELLSFLLKFKERKINFHFEIAADLLDEEMIDLMGQAPAGYFQVEIGVQSTNLQVLKEIQRKMDFFQVGEAVNRLREKGNVHLHLDLIAGLPKEDMMSFEKSFNEVYDLKPDNLQLGFLKLLKGSGLRAKAEQYGLVFQDQPPYEILATNVMTFDELVELKKIEDIIEQYHNSGKYKHALIYGINCWGKGPFSFFRGLAGFWQEKSKERMLSSDGKTKLLFQYLRKILPEQDEKLFFDLLKLDWLSSEPRNTIPDWLGGDRRQDRTINLAEYLPWARGMTPKEVYKKAAVERFHYFFIVENGIIIDIKKEESKAIIDYSQDSAGKKKPIIMFTNIRNSATFG